MSSPSLTIHAGLHIWSSLLRLLLHSNACHRTSFSNTSLQCSQKSATELYHKLVQSISQRISVTSILTLYFHLRPDLPSGFFPILHAVLVWANHILLDVIIIITLSSSLYTSLPPPPLTSLRQHQQSVHNISNCFESWNSEWMSFRMESLNELRSINVTKNKNGFINTNHDSSY